MDLKKLNEEYISIINNNYEQNNESYLLAKEEVKESTAYYHGKPISFPYIPKFFDKGAYNFLKESCDITYSILTKIIKEYLINPSYRLLFGFDKELEELILLDRGYLSYLPIARFDIFFNEEDYSFKFCEFNADGTSAMNEDRELARIISSTLAYKKLNEKYEIKPFELIESLVDEILNVYLTYPKKKENPFVGIVDFMESATPNEFIIIKEAFIKKGFQCEVLEIRDLIYKEDGLYTKKGKKIDLIYRRAVSGELFEKRGEVGSFLKAVREGKVCLMGHFLTQVIHNKRIFIILHKEETFKFLTKEEIEFIKKHVPITVSLTDETIKEYNVLENKDKWLLKPEDLYGARGIFAGRDLDPSKWEKAVNENKNNLYLLQEFAPIYKSLNTEFEQTEPFKAYNNLLGMFMYNGKLKGFFSRLGRNNIIADAYMGRTAPTYLIKENESK